MNRSHRRRLLNFLAQKIIPAGLLWATISHGAYAVKPPALRTVALSHGAAAPGTNENFELFTSLPVLNDAGQTAFSAWAREYVVDDPDFYLGYGIWSEGTGSLILAARGGDVAPGTTQTIQYLSDPAIDAAGRTVFRSRLSLVPGTPYEGAGVHRFGTMGLESLAVVGQEAADFASGHIFSWFSHPQVNDAGHIAFRGGLGTTIPHGVEAYWVGDPLEPQLALRTGAEELGETRKYSVNSLRSTSDTADAAAFNGSGELVFEAWLSREGLPLTILEHSIWRHDEDGAALLVRQEDNAPGTGKTFARFGTPALNDAGQIVFTAEMTNPNDYWRPEAGGVWMIDGDILKNILPAAMPAPGMPGVTLHSAGGSPVINGQGEVTFAAYLQGDGVTHENDESLWRLKGDSLELIARQGDLIPGSDSRYLGLGSFAINGAGQVAFMSSRQEFGNVSVQLLVQNSDGSLVEIANTGSLLEVAPGDFRTLTLIEFLGGSGLEDGRRVGFNERGQVAFRADFADGSTGLFVSSLAAIPEPAGLALAVVAATAMMTSQRRRRCDQ